MARSRSRKSTKRKTPDSDAVLGPRPFQDAARKGLAWGITGIANANHYQAKALAGYARRTKSQLSAIEYERLMKCASAIEKVHKILYDLASEMDVEIARRWKLDPTIPPRSRSDTPKERGPRTVSESAKPPVSKPRSAKRQQTTASSA